MARAVRLAADATLLVDERGVIVAANALCERLLGYDPDDLLGRPVESLLPEALRARHATSRASYAGRPATRGLGSGLDLFALRGDGREIAIDISLHPVRTPDGLRVIAALRDQSERHQGRRMLLRLAYEQAALRRVATAVAEDLDTGRLHDMVAAEVHAFTGARSGAVLRARGVGRAEVAAWRDREGDRPPPSGEVDLPPASAARTALEEGRSAVGAPLGPEAGTARRRRSASTARSGGPSP